MPFRGENIAEVTARSVSESLAHFADVAPSDGRARDIARDVLPELESRLGFLELVGLGYLTLDRAAPTLSGGEAQRIRLAAQLGSNLRGVCYILDEPTIGLHPRDNDRAARHDRRARGARQHDRRRRARRGDDPPRRARRRSRARRGPQRRRGHRERHARGPARERALDTGRVLASPPQHPLQPRRAVPARRQSARRRNRRSGRLDGSR